MASNLLQANAILKVRDFPAAEAFYTRLGFTRDWVYRGSSGDSPSYGGFSRDGVGLHVSSFAGDGVFGSAMLIYVRDVDTLHGELKSQGVSIELEPVAQTWGTREMYVRDPDGNTLRFCQGGASPVLDGTAGV